MKEHIQNLMLKVFNWILPIVDVEILKDVRAEMTMEQYKEMVECFRTYGMDVGSSLEFTFENNVTLTFYIKEH